MLITEIQRFCMHDGPGLRTTVFLKGCPLRCAWCHNPETQISQPQILFDPRKCIACRACENCPNHAQIFEESHRLNRTKCINCGFCAGLCPTEALILCGKNESLQNVLEILEKDRAFYGTSGGMTLSGGEPFAQPKEAIRLLKACKERGIHTAAETCGYFSPEIIPEIVPLTDLFLWDVKLTDDRTHRRYTGVSNRVILQNLRLADQAGAKTILRCILVNGVNTRISHYEALAGIFHTLRNCRGIEFLPYHAYAGSKAALLGKEDNGNAGWIPSDETVDFARRYLQERKVPVI